MIEWKMLHPEMTYQHLGSIPSFLHEEDARPAKEQFNSRYISGWDAFKGFTMLEDGVLKHPGDPPLQPLAETHLRDEHIRFYRSCWVSITQLDGSYEVARLD